jgi:hypothetical protein
MAPVLEGKSIGLDPKKPVLKGELLIWRTKNEARDQGTLLVQLKDSICFKSVQIGS